MLIIPAIDILNNKVARLTKGDFDKAKYYDTTPLAIARKYEEAGFQWLHIVDLGATLDKKINVLPIIREIKNYTGIKVEFGGGIRNLSQVEEVFKAGADRIVIGSLSIRDKNTFERIVELYGAEKIVVALDSYNEKIFIKGWTEDSGVSIYEHINYCKELGINIFLCTDISRDGTLTGSNTQLYRKIMEYNSDIKLIASGGIGSIHDVLMLSQLNVYAVVVGKAIYENKINIKDLAKIGSKENNTVS
ncbi:1-(5-phosphoribosyl)-5-[(5-phosphoribosylamino)methylideneamino]imidazole-4-carboxamide isomerase [Melioribacter sp. OK-6-Me]|uniref:1-(5-phosphoribosyl)-5-[(5- phosphoribosylamino)methylideneamino]imidazole-4- carboxamide isomerase n=1 Tax=unclassified Melioribacter TaxID=2627329 RepID=UPI003ED9C8DF